MINRDKAKVIVRLMAERMRETHPSAEENLCSEWKSYLMQHWNKDCFPLLAEVKGRPVGYAIMCISERVPTIGSQGTRHAEICELYVRREYRGKGYEEMLINACLGLAANMGVSKISAESSPREMQIFEKYDFKARETNLVEMSFNLESL